MENTRSFFTLFIVCFLFACSDDDTPITIDSPGVVQLDQIGVAQEGWTLGGLVVSSSGSDIYFASNNVQTSKYEVKTIDASGEVSLLFSGIGNIDFMDISDDSEKLLYTLHDDNPGNLRAAKMYEYYIEDETSGQLLSVQGDGYFWWASYLPDGNILFNQGSGGIGVSVRVMERATRNVTVLLDKDQGAVIRDVHTGIGRILLKDWESDMGNFTMNLDGTDIRQFGENIPQIRPKKFSADGTEILASEIFNPFVGPGGDNSYIGATSYDLATGEKRELTPADQDYEPVGYWNDKGTLIVRSSTGTPVPGELFLYDMQQESFAQITQNTYYEEFLGFFMNTTDRILFYGYNSTDSGLFIYNRQ